MKDGTATFATIEASDSAGSVKILVLAHNLSDAAVQRRVTMLHTGGAIVTVAGFRRTAKPIESIGGSRAVDFGRTYNAGFLHRVYAVLREVLSLKARAKLFTDADVIIARNLEMLAIAVRGRRLAPSRPVLVYECLDIHRLMFNQGPMGIFLRTLEGFLCRRASALLTSSPAFVSNYFNRKPQVNLPVRMVENKVHFTDEIPTISVEDRPAGPPWIIGWFGIIRCQRSFEILKYLVQKADGKVEVIIRGRPAPEVFGNFDKRVANLPHLRFMGPYNNPQDLAEIYKNVHFTWTIDMFEFGMNSTLLLPNRAYEGGLFGAVPIAKASVETGNFLRRLDIGVILKDPLSKSLADFFRTLQPEQYRVLERAVLRVPRSTWAYSREDCTDLVKYLSELRYARGLNS